MIVAFDGNVFVGKTTLINDLSSQMKCQLILEHSFFVNKIKKDKRYSLEFIEHLRYLYVDYLRIENIKKGINLLDRSFVSLSAHVYALYISYGIDLRAEHLLILKKLLDKKKIIVPNVYIYIACDWKIARGRFLKNKYDRNTPDMFMDKGYFFNIDMFNRLWQAESLSHFVVESENIDQNKLIKLIMKYTKNRQKKMSLGDIICLTEKIFFQK